MITVCKSPGQSVSLSAAVKQTGGFLLGCRAGAPELAGRGLGGVAGDQQVAPVQVPVLKLTRLLCYCQAQSSLQAASTCCSAVMEKWRGRGEQGGLRAVA